MAQGGGYLVGCLRAGITVGGYNDRLLHAWPAGGREGELRCRDGIGIESTLTAGSLDPRATGDATNRLHDMGGRIQAGCRVGRFVIVGQPTITYTGAGMLPYGTMVGLLVGQV